MSGKKNSYPGFKIILAVMAAVLLFAAISVIRLCVDMVSIKTGEDQPNSAASAEEPENIQPTDAPVVVKSVTIGSQGDLLMHRPIMKTCLLEDGQTYDFSSVFRYMTEYADVFDCSVVNLETTLGGDQFPYQGNPSFNCPDSIVDAAKAAGYDVLLTANNHCYDTGMTGLSRTVEQIRSRGLIALGTRLNTEEKRYSVVDIDGVKVGMICFTYAIGDDGKGGLCLNGGDSVAQPSLMNYFPKDNPDILYGEVRNSLVDMKAEGAGLSIVYIHWGEEYEIEESESQRKIAQQLCDLGVDVIIGSHPHVMQPMDLFTSTIDPEHKTICIFSLGNAVSNQRVVEMNLKTGHTEDGAIFTLTLDQYSDGSVAIADVGVIPTWVNLSNVNGKTEYNILPLDDVEKGQWKERFNLTDSLLSSAGDSYLRTMTIVSPGLEKVQNYLNQQAMQRQSAA